MGAVWRSLVPDLLLALGWSLMTTPFWAHAVSREDGAVADGIHLLWTAPYAAGYSVTGFDIQRRVSRWEPSLNCYTLTQVDLDLLHGVGRFLCPVALVGVSAAPC